MTCVVLIADVADDLHAWLWHVGEQNPTPVGILLHAADQQRDSGQPLSLSCASFRSG